MKILIFLFITFNLYPYLSKNERYPRAYTYYEKLKFKEIALRDNRKWPLNIKFIETNIIFGGTPQERIYIKKSIEEINKIFKSVKVPIIKITVERDIHNFLPAWVGGNSVNVPAIPGQNKELGLFISPNIEEWKEFDPKKSKPILGGAVNAGNYSIFSGEEIAKQINISKAKAMVYTNIYNQEHEKDFFNQSYLDYKRVHTFTHELMHILGFASHVSSVYSVMNTDISRDYIRGSRYTHGPLDWDIIFLEMKYNKLFDTYEDEEEFLEKLYNNKMRRPDRRSRREKLLDPIID